MLNIGDKIDITEGNFTVIDIINNDNIRDKMKNVLIEIGKREKTFENTMAVVRELYDIAEELDEIGRKNKEHKFYYILENDEFKEIYIGTEDGGVIL